MSCQIASEILTCYFMLPGFLTSSHRELFDSGYRYC